MNLPLEANRQRMVALLDRLTTGEGIRPSCLDGVSVGRVTHSHPRAPVLYEPSVRVAPSLVSDLASRIPPQHHESVGYESALQFSREFTRFFGAGPSDQARRSRTRGRSSCNGTRIDRVIHRPPRRPLSEEPS